MRHEIETNYHMSEIHSIYLIVYGVHGQQVLVLVDGVVHLPHHHGGERHQQDKTRNLRV